MVQKSHVSCSWKVARQPRPHKTVTRPLHSIEAPALGFQKLAKSSCGRPLPRHRAQASRSLAWGFGR